MQLNTVLGLIIAFFGLFVVLRLNIYRNKRNARKHAKKRTRQSALNQIDLIN